MEINKEILNANYWEHFKSAKDLSLYLPPEHPKRILIQKSMNCILEKIKAEENKLIKE
jgi:hypothetical protein